MNAQSQHVEFAERMRAFAGARLGGSLREGSLIRLTGGASQETWAFDVVGHDGIVPLILRRMPSGVALIDAGIGPELEAWLIRCAHRCGVPEPGVRHVLDPEDALGRGFVMERVEGETLARRILRDDIFADVRPRLARMCGEILARIHAIDMREAPRLPVQPALAQVEELEAVHRNANCRSAVFELALRWLRQNIPEEVSPPRLVHGDFRNGNLIIGREGVRAVLDWELAHLGDPAEDLGYITVNSWRFGAIDKPVGGFGTIEQLLEGYLAAGGPPIDMERILFWQVMGSLRWGLMCREMARPPEPDAPITVERAMIGRRVSETELDLLDLLAPEKTA